MHSYLRRILTLILITIVPVACNTSSKGSAKTPKNSSEVTEILTRLPATTIHCLAFRSLESLRVLSEGFPCMYVREVDFYERNPYPA